MKPTGGVKPTKPGVEVDAGGSSDGDAGTDANVPEPLCTPVSIPAGPVFGETEISDGGIVNALLPTKLINVSGGNDAHLSLLGIVGSDLVYETWHSPSSERPLFALPLTGDACPTKIAPGTGRRVTGGAMVRWTGYGDLHELSAWPRTTGLVTLGPGWTGRDDPSNRAVNPILASDDGSRIAFVEAQTQSSLQIRVRNIADSNASTLLTGDNALNVAASECPPSMTFVGKTFFVAFCPGTTSTANAAKLVMVRENGAIVRLDAATDEAAPTLKPGQAWGPPTYPAGPAFVADRTGTTLFVRRLDSKGAVITVGSGAPSLALLPDDIAEGTLLSDGSAVIYRTTGNVLKRATTASPSVATTLAPEARGVLTISPDDKVVVFHQHDPVLWTTDKFAGFDVSAVDSSGVAPAITLVSTSSTSNWQINRASTHLVFRDLTEPQSFAYYDGKHRKAIALSGGASNEFYSNGPFLFSEGTTAISHRSYNGTGFDIQPLMYRDLATGASVEIASSLDAQPLIHQDRLFYAMPYTVNAGIGLYTTRLP